MASEKSGRPDPRKDRRRMKRPEGAGLEESLLAKYSQAGIQILADEVPKRLDPSLRTELESITGAELADVRLHTGERAQQMAESLGARAFAAGSQDVFFAKGEFTPSSAEGKALLAHEVTHVAEGHVGLARPLRKAEREDLEVKARSVEKFVLAEEQAPEAKAETDMKEPQAVEVPSPGAGNTTLQTRSVTVDKAELEDKVYNLIERELRRERERVGRV